MGIKNRAVHVLFLNAVENDQFVNRLTHTIGAYSHGIGACHVEISIPDPTGYITSSIYNGECVHMTTKKTFSNPGQYSYKIN